MTDLYRIKPLVWRESNMVAGQFADLPCGLGRASVMPYKTEWRYHVPVLTVSYLGAGPVDTEAEAKAAVESWYRARIAEALEPATPEASKTNAVAAETGPEPASLSAEVARLQATLAAIAEDGTEEHNAAVALRSEVARLRAALRPFVVTASHHRVFLTTSERIHPHGAGLFDEDVDRARAALGEDATC